MNLNDKLKQERTGLTASQYSDLQELFVDRYVCLLYTSPSPRDGRISRMPSSA